MYIDFLCIIFPRCGLLSQALYAEQFFVYFAVLIASSINMSAYFRMLASLASSETAAQALAGPSTGIMMLFGG